MAGSDTEATVMLNVVPGMNTGITAFNAGLSSINAQFQNITDTINSTFGIMDAMIVSTGMMVAQFGMGAANAFGEFEQGMQIVKAVSQQSGEAIAYLKQEAQDFAVQYRTGIDSITEGLQTLGRAGLNSAQEQTEVLEQGLQTAKLEGRDLNSVLEEIIQNTSLLGGDIRSDQFGEQAEYLNNLLVGTSLSAPLDTHDISETLKYSGGMVAAAGGTIATDDGYANEAGREIVEDYMGAVAAFAQKGVKGSIAGTALRAFFNKPAAQDQSVVDALSAIGLAPEDLWDNEETMKPVSEQIELIQTQMAAHNVSKMDQMQLWSKIVGGKMGQQMMKLDAQDIREMTTDIQDASSARDLAEQTFNTYNQQANKFSEEGQKAFREFGEHIVTALRPALEILTRLMDVLSNPAVSFGGFVAFMAIIGHSMQAVTRIASRLKGELSWLLGGKKFANFNPQQMLDSGVMQIKRPSDIFNQVSSEKAVTGLSTSAKKQQKKQEYFTNMKSSISEIKNQMAEMIENTQNQFNNLDLNVDVNLDDIKKEIKLISEEAIQTIKLITLEANKSANQIKNNITDAKKTITDSSVANAQDTFYEPINRKEQIKLGDIIRDRKYYTKDVLADMLVDSGSDMTKGELMKLKKAELASMAYPLINKDANADFMEFQMEMKKSFPDLPHEWRIDEETGGYYNLRENEWGDEYRAKAAAMEEEYFNKSKEVLDTLFAGAKEAAVLANSMKEQELTGEFATTDIHPNSGSKKMDDFIRFQIKQKEMFPDLPHEWRIDEKTGEYYNLREDEWDPQSIAAAKEAEAEYLRKSKEVLDILFAEAKQAAATAAAEKEAELAGQPYWGGMTEDEFNRDYYRKHKKPWELDKDEIQWADKANRTDSENYIDEYNKRNGDLVAKRDSLGNFLGYGSKEEYHLTGDDVAGLNSLLGEGEEYNRLEKFKYRINQMVEPGSDFYKNHETTSKVYRRLGEHADTLKEKFNGFAKSLGSEKTNAIGKVVDILGGPFSTAIIGATAAMELYNYAFGQWQKNVQEHQTKLSKAQDSLSEAEGNIREEFLKNNPDATPEEADQAVSDAYLAIEDNNYDMSALDANTQALYVATYQVQRASDLLEGDAMHNAFGVRGSGTLTNLSDNLVTGLTNEIFGVWGTQVVQDNGEMGYAWGKLGFGYNTQAGSILDNDNQAVLTGSQASDDYVYSKENAAIFAADVWAASKEKGREAIDGLWDFFGTDVKHFQEVNRSIFGGTSDFGNSYYTHVTDMLDKNFSSSTDQHHLQMFLKNNQKDAQKLAKDIRKFEKANKGKSPLSFFTDSKGRKVPQDKALKNLEVRDKDLVKYLRSLSIKTGMSAQQLLMASQLQQMQDLNQIMTEQLQPQVVGLAQNAYQQLSAQQGIGSSTSSTSSGSWSTYNAAAAIASKLNVLVEQALDTEMQQDYIAAGGQNQEYIDNPQKMKADMVAAFNTPESQRTEQQKTLVNTYGKKWFESYYLSGWDTGHPDATPEQREGALKNFDKVMAQYDNFGKLVADTRKGTNDYYAKALVAAYDASSLGEPGESPSGGSGGGGGGDKDKDKDSGTKKERVDLVLCNKKEIPKLNVNLFKKAPQFTVLNKNFKLRDIKINTQDKPKAVLASLKNAIIDTQKRMDPKIIQDEEAEYDPVAATDGNSTPSGSTSTTTDD